MIEIIEQSGHHLKYDKSIYPGGETFVRLKANPGTLKEVTLKAHLRSSDDILLLLNITDAVRRINPDSHIKLICPYFPAARQDRVCNVGEALGVKVIADLINSQKYSTVEIWDPHSDVTPALIDRCIVREQYDFTRLIPTKYLNDTVVVAPDAGAAKKAFKVAQGLGLPMIQATKHRDLKIGDITDTTVAYYDHCEPGTNYLIVDDICDGGRTFIELAKYIKQAKHLGKIYLYVTHGIFSKGMRPLLDSGIDHIFTANPWPVKMTTGILMSVAFQDNYTILNPYEVN